MAVFNTNGCGAFEPPDQMSERIVRDKEGYGYIHTYIDHVVCSRGLHHFK